MIGIERIDDIEKNIFVQKHFLSPIYFNGISWLNLLLFLRERLQGLLSIPISIRDGNLVTKAYRNDVQIAGI